MSLFPHCFWTTSRKRGQKCQLYVTIEKQYISVLNLNISDPCSLPLFIFFLFVVYLCSQFHLKELLLNCHFFPWLLSFWLFFSFAYCQLHMKIPKKFPILLPFSIRLWSWSWSVSSQFSRVIQLKILESICASFCPFYILNIFSLSFSFLFPLISPSPGPYTWYHRLLFLVFIHCLFSYLLCQS